MRRDATRTSQPSGFSGTPWGDAAGARAEYVAAAAGTETGANGTT